MRLLIWLWEHTGTELFVTDGEWDWDEWHAFWFGVGEKCGKPSHKTLPEYIFKDRHYYNVGCGAGTFLAVGMFIFWGLVFVSGLYLIGHLVPLLLLKGLVQ